MFQQSCGSMAYVDTDFVIYIYIYLIKLYRYPLSTHFCIYPFELLHWFYGID